MGKCVNVVTCSIFYDNMYFRIKHIDDSTKKIFYIHTNLKGIKYAGLIKDICKAKNNVKDINKLLRDKKLKYYLKYYKTDSFHNADFYILTELPSNYYTDFKDLD